MGRVVIRWWNITSLLIIFLTSNPKSWICSFETEIAFYCLCCFVLASIFRHVIGEKIVCFLRKFSFFKYLEYFSPYSKALSNSWINLELVSATVVIIWAGPLSFVLVLYDFNGSFRTEIFFWCFFLFCFVLFLFFVALSTGVGWWKYFLCS